MWIGQGWEMYFWETQPRKENNNFFENSDTKKCTNSKTFWKTLKPMFSSKSRIPESTTSVNDDAVVLERNVTSFYNKRFRNLESTCRPITILPGISKVYER